MLHLSHTYLKVFLYSSFTFIEYVFFAYILYLNIKKLAFHKVILITSLIFTIFLIIFYFGTNLKKIDSIPIGVETIIIFLYSFYFLYEQMNNTETLFIYNKYSFWLILGMLMYLAGGFFIYIFANQLEATELHKYWFFTNIFIIIKNILFVIAIFINSKQTTTQNKMYTYSMPSLK